MVVDCFKGPHCSSLPFQPMYSQKGSVCVLCLSHRNSTTSLRVEKLSLCAASLMFFFSFVNGNSSTGGWFGILGGTHEKDCVLFMSL